MKRFALVAFITASLAIAYAMDASTCAYRALTGHPCIFCGMTHALVAAMHGNWSAASAANPAWWLIATAFTIVVARRTTPGWWIVAVVVIASLLRAL